MKKSRFRAPAGVGHHSGSRLWGRHQDSDPMQRWKVLATGKNSPRVRNRQSRERVRAHQIGKPLAPQRVSLHLRHSH